MTTGRMQIEMMDCAFVIRLFELLLFGLMKSLLLPQWSLKQGYCFWHCHIVVVVFGEEDKNKNLTPPTLPILPL